MPGKVECPDGWEFIIPDGGELLPRSGEDSLHLGEVDRDDLEWVSIFGTPGGYKIVVYGRQQAFEINVTPVSVTSSPVGHEGEFPLAEGNVLILSGGTKITPIEGTNGTPSQPQA